MRLRLNQIPLFFILGLGLLLRLPLLNASFWLDEAAQVLESARPLSQQLNIVDDFQPPFIHILVHFELLFSQQEWWLRLGVAIIPSLITIWATYYIGKKLFSVWVGAFAGLLLATSSFAIFYAQELRPYALPAMFAAVSWAIIIQWLEQSKDEKQWKMKKLSTVLFILFSIAGCYSSYLYPFLFFTQFLFVFWNLPKYRKNIGVATSLTVITFLPWLPMFLAQLHAGQSLRADLPGWQNVVSFDQLKSLALTAEKFLLGVIHVDFNSAFFVFAFLGTIVFVPLLWNFGQPFLRNYKDKNEMMKIQLILLWLICPILFIWLVSFVVPVLQPKRVLFCLPAFYILISFIVLQPLQNMGRQLKKKVSFLQLQVYAASVLAIFLLITLNIWTMSQYFAVPKYQREDWRGIHQQILTQYPTKTIVIFAFPEAFAPWRWYDDGKYPVVTTGVLTTDSLNDLSVLRKVTDYDTVLVFDYLRDLTDPQNKIDAQLKSYGFTEVNQITPKTELGIIHVYQKKERRVS